MSGPKVLSFAQLPSVDRLLNLPEVLALIDEFGRSEVKRVIQQTLELLRDEIKQGKSVDSNEATLSLRIALALTAAKNGRIRPVFNLTGTILHTNLGRAVLPQGSIDAVVEVMSGTSNLEYDLETGRRGDRDSFLEKQICRLTGAEAATVVNNNAAAVMLILNTLALGKEVPVSRGELVEIGGSFRIPEIMRQSGCHLVEVGTTNRTHARDFADAVNADTGLIMKVHQSNYTIQGFTAAVDVKELAKLCAAARIPFVVDLGSGTLIDLEDYGLPPEPTPMQSLAAGADLVTFSGDKLLGGPQAGIVVGRRDLIQSLNANPMKRALRCDKMTIAALSALLEIYNHAEQLPEHLPVLKTMTRGVDDIREMATPLVSILADRLTKVAMVSLLECDSEIGSGALPDRTIPSVGIAIRPLSSTHDHDLMLSKIASAFRELPVPVIGRINKGNLILDCRCLENVAGFSAQLEALKIAE